MLFGKKEKDKISILIEGSDLHVIRILNMIKTKNEAEVGGQGRRGAEMFTCMLMGLTENLISLHTVCVTVTIFL